MNADNPNAANVTGNSSFGDSVNATDDIPTAAWTALPVITLITTILGVLLNSLLLLLFCTRRTLWTPFNVYLINLVIANLILVLVQYPLDVIADLHALAWLTGEASCGLYIYAIYVLQGVTGNLHQLIAVNRLWAVVHPISYRNRHSFRTAVGLSLGVWLFVHVSDLPGVINDRVYYPLPNIVVNGCGFNVRAQQTFAEYCQIFIYNVPICTMTLALPVIWFSKNFRDWRERSKNLVEPASTKAKEKSESRTRGTAASREPATRPETDVGNDDAVGPRRRRPLRGSKRGNLVLIVLTISFVITWTPVNTYFTMQLFLDGEWPRFYEIATIIFSFQPVMDPILFTLAVGSVRNEVVRLANVFCRTSI